MGTMYPGPYVVVSRDVVAASQEPATVVASTMGLHRLITPREVAIRGHSRGFGPLEPSPGRAVRYQIESAETVTTFEVPFLGVLTVRGTVPGMRGTIDYHTADVRRWAVQAELPLADLNTGIRLRDAHLRSADYLDIARFPLAAFRSTAVECRESDMQVHGILAVRDRAKPVVIQCQYPDTPVSDGNGRELVSIRASLTINRREFGILGHQPGGWRLDPRDVTIGNEVDLRFVVRAARPLPA